jgi:hypothetical protein
MNSYWTCGSKTAAHAVALTLALQLAASPPAWGQNPPTIISIVMVKGDGAIGRVGQRAEENPVIRVVDDRKSPVSGAAVVFTLPTEGATGAFANGSKTLMTLTDTEGSATAALRYNQVPGKVPIHINVSYKGATAHATIMQITQAPAGYKARTGGGAGGAWYALRKTSSPPSSPVIPSVAIGITPGVGAIAPPR